MKKILGMIMLFCLGASAEAQMKPQVLFEVPWGDGPKEIGRMKFGDEYWHPLQFALGPEGNFYIPDFYHQRIQVYDAKGTWTAALAVPELNPRLRYFGISDSYILMVDDRNLLTYDLKGKKLAEQKDVFLFPQFVYLSKKGIFMEFNNQIYKIDPELKSMNEVSFSPREWGIKPLQDDFDRFFPKDLQHLIHFGAPAQTQAEGWTFLGSQASGQSLWLQSSQGADNYRLLDPQGQVLRQETYSKPEGTPSFQTGVDKNLNLYRTQFTPQGIKFFKLGW